MMKNVAGLIFFLLLTACATEYPVAEEYKPLDYENLTQNVTIHEKTPAFIVYEYKNVKVDDVAGLAAVYCYTQNKQEAYLRQISLNKNRNRLATFDCIDLQ